MINLLLFAGTTEGRILAERLASLPVRATLCVATDYGGEMLDSLSERFDVRVGRMESDMMHGLMTEGGFDYVIDATHPYATCVSLFIAETANRTGTAFLRLVRESGNGQSHLSVPNSETAARALVELPGNVLLTTGAKELAAFTLVAGFADRMYPRVLPSVESIGECVRLGFRRSRILAMQGPFTRELNRALMRQFDIAVMVTKDGGKEGGFQEKMLAAEDAGVRVVVIGRPPERGGHTLEQILSIVEEKLEERP